MDSFEYNKIIGALLGTIFIVFSIALVSDSLFYSPNPEKPGYAIEAKEAPAAGGAEKKENPAKAPIAPLLASADVKKGEAIFKRCEACHDATKGGPNKVGPNLYGVVGRPIASHEGYSYSSGMKTFSDGGKKHWTFQLLSEFITKPKAEVPGTAMGFAGLSKIEERADVIAYLHNLSDNPLPLPSPDEAKPAAEGGDAAKPAEGAKPADSAEKPADNAEKPAEGAKPADNAAKPAEESKPADNAAKPADEAAKPAEDAKPAGETKPAEGSTAPAQ